MKKTLFSLFVLLLATCQARADIVQDTDGFYKLSTPADLEEFAMYIRSGKSNIKGKLMNDIDMSSVENFFGIGPQLQDRSAISGCGIA